MVAIIVWSKVRGGVRCAPADRGKQERKNDWGFRVVAALAVGVSARFP